MLMTDEMRAEQDTKRHQAYFQLGVQAVDRLDEMLQKDLGAETGSEDERFRQRFSLAYKVEGAIEDVEKIGMAQLRAAGAVDQIVVSLHGYAQDDAKRRGVSWWPHVMELVMHRPTVFRRDGVRLPDTDLAARVSAAIGVSKATAFELVEAIFEVISETGVAPPPYEFVGSVNGMVRLQLDPKP